MTIDFDWKEFELVCKKIVGEVSDKFIDLGMDDGPHSAFGDGMQNKMEKFKKEFTR